MGRHLSDRRIPCCSWLSFSDFRDDGSGDVSDVHILRSLVSPPGFWFQGKMMKNDSRISGNLWVSASITVLQFLLTQKNGILKINENHIYNSGYLKGAELSFREALQLATWKPHQLCVLRFKKTPPRQLEIYTTSSVFQAALEVAEWRHPHQQIFGNSGNPSK